MINGLLNVGNTNSEFTLFENGEIQKSWRLSTRDLLDNPDRLPLDENDGAFCLVASVVPAVLESLRERFNSKIRALRVENLNWIDFTKVNATTLGADRLANIAAGSVHTDGAFIVVDCGTAITTEVVNSQHQFCGGIIMPGRKLQRQALRDFTASLPMVTIDDDYTPKAIGTDTKESIAYGVDSGSIGAVKSIIEKSQQELGENATIWIAGGDADFYFEQLDIPGIKLAGSGFTMDGIAEVARRAN